MCGRYGLTIDQEALSIAYGVEALLTEHQPRYNIAPSQEVPVLLENKHGRRIESFRWGLVLSSSKDTKIGYRTINAPFGDRFGETGISGRLEAASTLPDPD